MPIWLLRSAICHTLLLALILSGTVPQGFMRSSDADGMALVLCSPDGLTEVWLTADGEIQDEAPADQPSSDMPDCLAVTLSVAMLQSWLGALAQPVEFSPYSATFIDRRSALIPAITPLQPRAPPVLI